MDTVEERVYRVVSTILRVPRETVNAGSSPATIKAWDSLGQMNLIMALEEEFAVRLTDDQVINLLNVGDIIATVRTVTGAA